MKKEKIIEFMKEFVAYFLTIVILMWIANKMGWMKSSILETSIELTIGWIIWKIIMLFLNKKNGN